MPPKRKERGSTSISASSPSERAARLKKADDAEVVLVKCRQLRDELRVKQEATLVAALPAHILQTIVEVEELDSAQVLEGMETIALGIANQVLAKQGISMEIPSRSAVNQIYIKEWDRIVLGDKRGTRSFLNVKVCVSCLLMIVAWCH